MIELENWRMIKLMNDRMILKIAKRALIQNSLIPLFDTHSFKIHSFYHFVLI